MSDFTRKKINFDFEYIDGNMQGRIVLISPDGKRKILPEEDKKQFIEDVDYTVEFKTSENSAADAISDLICKKYW
jgi:hypothetical protein